MKGMTMTEKVLFAWSGGKDSAMALYEALNSRKYDVAALLTTVTQDYDRVSMHGVRRVLLEEQAALSGLPLEIVLISKRPIFSRGIIFEKGQVVLRDNRFYYCDLVEVENLQTVSG